MAAGVRPGRAIASDGLGDRRAAEPEGLVGGDDHEGLRREAELVERAADREVGLVGGVDAEALQRTPPRRGAIASQPRHVHVAHERHPDEVRHHAAGGQDPEAALAVADEVAQPAQDLLLDERADRAGVPDVDALLGDLREDLAGHGGEQRRRGEVAERAWVVGAHRVRRDPLRELVEDLGQGRAGRPGRRRRAASLGPKNSRRSAR